MVPAAARRAVRDTGLAVALAATAAVAAVQPRTATAAVTVPVGLLVVVTVPLLVAGLAATQVLCRRPLVCSPADRVTLLRTVLVGLCAGEVMLALLGVVPPRTWVLVALAAPAALLDAVDGVVARRTGTASVDGARFDVATDTALVAVLAVPVAMVVGPWALTAPGLRLLFVLAGRVRPRLSRPLPPRRSRRTVAGIHSGAGVLALVPALPVPVTTALVAAALVVLTCSFVRDVVALERDGG